MISACVRMLLLFILGLTYFDVGFGGLVYCLIASFSIHHDYRLAFIVGILNDGQVSVLFVPGYDQFGVCGTVVSIKPKHLHDIHERILEGQVY